MCAPLFASEEKRHLVFITGVRTKDRAAEHVPRWKADYRDRWLLPVRLRPFLHSSRNRGSVQGFNFFRGPRNTGCKRDIVRRWGSGELLPVWKEETRNFGVPAIRYRGELFQGMRHKRQMGYERDDTAVLRRAFVATDRRLDTRRAFV